MQKQQNISQKSSQPLQDDIISINDSSSEEFQIFKVQNKLQAQIKKQKIISQQQIEQRFEILSTRSAPDFPSSNQESTKNDESYNKMSSFWSSQTYLNLNHKQREQLIGDTKSQEEKKEIKQSLYKLFFLNCQSLVELNIQSCKKLNYLKIYKSPFRVLKTKQVPSLLQIDLVQCNLFYSQTKYQKYECQYTCNCANTKFIGCLAQQQNFSLEKSILACKNNNRKVSESQRNIKLK